MRIFFDTNILVYSLDPADARKQLFAQDALRQYIQRREVVVSTQVMLELFNVLTRKLRYLPADALQSVLMLASHTVVPTGTDFAPRALALAVRYQLSTWDAAMVQAALDGHCDVMLTEDLQPGMRFGQLEVVNPFIPAAHQPVPAMALAPPAAAPAAPARSPRRRQK